MSNEATTPVDPTVITTVRGRLGHIELNRPRAINALNEEMVHLVDEALRAWATDAAIDAVLITGAGERGLCAGGDIKAVHAAITQGTSGALDFFSKEYRMNDLIATYPKPFIAIMDGITMGGGVGIAAHGSVRIVSDSTKIAMPETGIGLFPDVGATYLLARMPHRVGLYMGLSSESIGAADAVAYGLADYYVPADRLAELQQALAADPSEAPVRRSAADPGTPALAGDLEWIESAFAHDTAAEVVAALRARPEPRAQEAAEAIAAKSPRSVELTLRMIRSAADMDLRDVLERDLRVALNLGEHPDLVEGIRAQVIDKDRNPSWNPATLEAVDPAEIESILTDEHEQKVFA